VSKQLFLPVVRSRNNGTLVTVLCRFGVNNRIFTARLADKLWSLVEGRKVQIWEGPAGPGGHYHILIPGVVPGISGLLKCYFSSGEEDVLRVVTTRVNVDLTARYLRDADLHVCTLLGGEVAS